MAYCGLSASGKGYWGLVPIAYPERHSQHFDALKRVFAHYGILIDTKPRNVASLRGYSYDPAPYLPERVMLFELYDIPPKPKPRPFDVSERCRHGAQAGRSVHSGGLRQGTYVGDSYESWYAVGCSLAKWVRGKWPLLLPPRQPALPRLPAGQTDKQFTACLRANSKATLGTFFHLCQQHWY